MSFLLDTNVCSAFLRRPSALTHRFIQHTGRLYVSTVVLGELYTWAYSRTDSHELLKVIEDDLLAGVVALDFDKQTADQFGRLRSSLLRQGQVVNPVDLMIATVAIAHDLTLVTHNTKHFEGVPGLRLVDWTAS